MYPLKVNVLNGELPISTDECGKPSTFLMQFDPQFHAFLVTFPWPFVSTLFFIFSSDFSSREFLSFLTNGYAKHIWKSKVSAVRRSLTHSLGDVLTFRRGSQVNRFVCSVAADRQENRFTSLVQYFSTPKFTYSAQFVNAFVRLLINVLFLYSTLFPVKFDMNCNDF